VKGTTSDENGEAAKSFREKADLSQAGFALLFEWSSMELIRLCRHPSIRTLW
jgi:hypothetical protein